ncbi:MAG: phenylacetate--CoA ligase family protein [Candidatus Rokuibacteriota bacterium]
MAAPTLFKARTLAERFWNPHTETLPRRRLDALHLRKLQALVRYAHARSPMYRRLLDRAKVRPEQIRTMDDFEKRLPVIDKTDILDAQAAAPPFGEALAVPEDFFLHRFQTSGSTGAPLHIPLTYHSSLAWGESWVYLYWPVGLRPRHTFYFPFHDPRLLPIPPRFRRRPAAPLHGVGGSPPEKTGSRMDWRLT